MKIVKNMPRGMNGPLKLCTPINGIAPYVEIDLPICASHVTWNLENPKLENCELILDAKN